MKAAFIVEQAGGRALEYGEQPNPEPKDGEALIKVKAILAWTHGALHFKKILIEVERPIWICYC